MEKTHSDSPVTKCKIIATGIALPSTCVTSADLASRGIDWNHEESSLIFGDGAACAIVERGNGRSGIVASLIEMYPDGSELCEIRAGGTRCNPRAGMAENDFLFHMQGYPLFRYASSLIEDYFARLL